MNVSRYKKVEKYLKFYYNNFGFRQPYQVLIDGTFCFAAFTEHINIKEQIPKYLNGQVKLLTTRCIIIETEKISKKTHGALTILKQYGIHECNHKQPVSGTECILSMIGAQNDNHYILASQDRELQNLFRRKAGVPLLYLHNKTPTLERPSKPSYDKANAKLSLNSTTFVSESQSETLKRMKQALGVQESEQESMMQKRRRQHNPNPLSCKKKKKKGKAGGVFKNGEQRNNRKKYKKLFRTVKEGVMSLSL